MEVLLYLRTPGGPFDRSSLDALAELASGLKSVSFSRGHTFWREGELASAGMQAMAEGPPYHALKIDNISVQISPDGKWIAFTQTTGGEHSFEQPMVAIVPAKNRLSSSVWMRRLRGIVSFMVNATKC